MSYQPSFAPANPANYTKGRGGKHITTIVIHHWDDPARNPQLGGVIATCLPPPRELKKRVVSGFCSGQGRMREGQ